MIRTRVRLRNVARLVVAAASLVYGGRALAASSSDHAVEPEVRSYVVREDDTLWEIAASVSDDRDDPRRVVDAIRRLNGRLDPALVPGSTLLIPVAR